MKPSLDSKGAVTEPRTITLCPNSRAAYANHIETRDTALFASACKSRHCETCQELKRLALVKRICDASPSKFITLTCRHEGDPTAQLRKISKQLSQWAAWIRRTFGAIEYVRILEECKDGYPHFHLLARCRFLEQRTLAAKWEQLTGAQILDIRIAHGRSTRYVAKYIGKATAARSAWSRQKVSATRNFWKERETTDEFIGFHMADRDVWTAAADLATNHSLVRLRRGVYWLWEREPGDELPEELQTKDYDEPIDL